MNRTMLDRTFIGVVAAGGYSLRFGGGPPKALARVGQQTMLEVCIDELFGAGATACLVYNNRREWTSRLSSVVARYANVSLCRDTGGTSTIFLARAAARSVREGSICFVYGHAPRPAEHIRKLLLTQRHGVGMTLVATSSRRDPIVNDLGFLEPPLVFDARTLSTNSSRSWGEFIEQQRAFLRVVQIGGPPEANYRSEIHAYLQYVASFANNQPNNRWD